MLHPSSMVHNIERLLCSKRKIVEVEWVDSAATGGWNPARKFIESGTSRCRSVGYMIERSNKQIVLVTNLSDDTGNAGEGMAIPTACVKRVRILEKRAK